MSPSPATVAGALRADGVDIDDLTTPPTALPRDEAALVRTVRRAAAERWRVVPAGLAGKLAWCRPEVLGGEVDCVLSTRRLDQVVAYVPGDGTLTAQAGCRMHDLAQHVAAHGHRLTPAVPQPERATLGGTLGAGISGADRSRNGPARHHVLGMRVVLADGTVSTSGGRLVKNVTGFDLHRLFCGSRGTLCVQLEASLRLFPAPEAEQAWHLECPTAREALDAAATLSTLPIRPFAVTLAGTAGGATWSLDVALGGRRRQLADEREIGLRALGSGGLTVLEDQAAAARNERIRDLGTREERGASFRVTCMPSHLGQTLEVLERELEVAFDVVAQPQVASVEIFLEPGAPLTSSPARVGRLADALRHQGAHLEARAVAREVHDQLAPRLAQQPQLDWMFRLREAFDPDGLFASPLYPGKP